MKARFIPFLVLFAVVLLVAVAGREASALSEAFKDNIYNPGLLKPVDSVLKVKVGIQAPDFTLPSVACINGDLYHHDSGEITREMLDAAYHCPVDLVAHGIPHRVLGQHKEKRGGD
jgi:hypothetical protein